MIAIRHKKAEMVIFFSRWSNPIILIHFSILQTTTTTSDQSNKSAREILNRGLAGLGGLMDRDGGRLESKIQAKIALILIRALWRNK